MGKLVCNGSTLYRRVQHLVRTPITLTLQPSEMAYYAVAGTYSSQQFPNTGFITQNTMDNVRQMGYDMLNAYVYPRSSYQIWRQVNTAHLPETVWYQGAFATSAPNITSTFDSCEAYSQLSGYKFQTPPKLQGLTATQAILKFVNGGVIICYQSAGMRSTNNQLWNYDQGPWIHFAACDQLSSYNYVKRQPTAASCSLASTNRGNAQGVRDLWGFTGTSRDGGIPTLGLPPTVSIPVEVTAIQNRLDAGVWIVPHFDPHIYSVQNYTPYYTPPNIGYWACFSLWGLSLEVSYE